MPLPKSLTTEQEEEQKEKVLDEVLADNSSEDSAEETPDAIGPASVRTCGQHVSYVIVCTAVYSLCRSETYVYLHPSKRCSQVLLCVLLCYTSPAHSHGIHT